MLTMQNILAFSIPGGWELILIVLVVLVFFGAKRIPELAKGLGKGIREFKDATKEIKNDIEEGVKDDDNKSNNKK
jgi:sec-independent protein translocase protein TatA